FRADVLALVETDRAPGRWLVARRELRAARHTYMGRHDYGAAYPRGITPVGERVSIGSPDETTKEVPADDIRFDESLARSAARLRRPVHGDPRRDDRERRSAEHRARSAFLANRPAVGRQCVHIGLRRIPPARRTRGRSLR